MVAAWPSVWPVAWVPPCVAHFTGRAGGRHNAPYTTVLSALLRACANRRATFRTWHLSEGLNSLLTTAWHIRYSPIGAASKLNLPKIDLPAGVPNSSGWHHGWYRRP